VKENGESKENNLYTEMQSTVIALWVLSMARRANGKLAHGSNEAPSFIVDIVNKMEPSHSAASIFKHKWAYEKLFLERDNIEKNDATKLQIEVFNKLKSENLEGRAEKTRS